ncbi:hypothetical protein E1J38_009925 [Seonamhaeicola sediminis]|uniref:Copper-binding protein MbnP-like domain-containing protein n=1 Tax=Seonamhaeicola sediminis TaxID=2528206 RepID=A0A562YDC3_9FLAO|nr:MbnP family protein [Seonamhaeicola sediminis]TWO32135.1 hypothetical protein E1J38_009925 [Seonamhaeicola sediminis]
MKKIASLLILLLLLSCSSDDESKTYNITLSFSHNWDGTPITNSDFNTIKFTNANNNQLSIERLRYLISDIKLESNNEVINLEAYKLIDVSNNKNLSFSPSVSIPEGTYSEVSFTFGFNNEDNDTEDGYNDLNVALFNVPSMLGGGYHYMQLDGKFINSNNEEQGYNYHAIRAVDNPGTNPTFPQDTFFKVTLGNVIISKNTTLNIEMNVAEWFKNPHIWDLNALNQMLMPNSTAQIMMYNNGQNVFSLKPDTP